MESKKKGGGEIKKSRGEKFPLAVEQKLFN